MEVFILLHSDVYETSNGRIIACSLFRENLIEKMNNVASAENEKIQSYAYQREPANGRLFMYNAEDDSWVKWNGKNWTERLSIERFDMS